MRQEAVKAAKGTSAAKRHSRTRRALVLAVVMAIGAGGAAIAAPLAPVIISPADGASVNSTAVTVHGTVSGDAVLVRVFDGASAVGDTGPAGGYFSVAVGLADGPHALRARARDAGGVWGPFSAVHDIVVDTGVPAPPVITAPVDGQVVGFSGITVEGTAEPGAHVRVRVSTGAVLEAVADAAGDWAVARSFSDTEHTLIATATDAAGNTSLDSAAVTFRVDTIAPTPPVIYTPGNGAFRATSTVAFTGSAEPGATVKVYRGGTIIMTTPASDGTWSGTVTLAEGVHTVTARAFDVAGNPSAPSPQTTFTVDLTAPAAPVIATPRPGDVLPGSYTVEGRSEPHATIELLRTNLVVARGTADANGNWSIPQLRPSGEQILKARQIDRAGNVGPLTSTISFLVDAEAPPRPTFDTKNGTIFLPLDSPMITGTATDDIGVLAISLEYYDLLGKAHRIFNANCQGCPAGDVIWNTTYEPLPGRYVIKAYAVDRAGNRSLPAELIIWRI